MLQDGMRRLTSAVRVRFPLTIGLLSAAQAGAVCCTISSSCTRVAAVRPRRYSLSVDCSSSTNSSQALRERAS
eukprot:4122721-Prymnesium_polylepis.1